MHPTKIATRITPEYREYLTTLVGQLDRLCDSGIGGQELYYALLALHLDDPIGPMCNIAGTDTSGAVQCYKCPLGPEVAGCMTVLYPVFLKLLKGNTRPAKLDISNFIYKISIAIEIYDRQSNPNTTDI